MTSKIHRATVTRADLDYVGSVTVDADLLDAADLMPGERGAGQVCINGAAAHLISPGHTVILIAYSQMEDAEARTYLPHVVFVDKHNRIVERGSEPGQIPVDSDAARLQGLAPSGLSFAAARS